MHLTLENFASFRDEAWECRNPKVSAGLKLALDHIAAATQESSFVTHSANPPSFPPTTARIMKTTTLIPKGPLRVAFPAKVYEFFTSSPSHDFSPTDRSNHQHLPGDPQE